MRDAVRNQIALITVLRSSAHERCLLLLLQDEAVHCKIRQRVIVNSKAMPRRTHPCYVQDIRDTAPGAVKLHASRCRTTQKVQTSSNVHPARVPRCFLWRVSGRWISEGHNPCLHDLRQSTTERFLRCMANVHPLKRFLHDSAAFMPQRMVHRAVP